MFRDLIPLLADASTSSPPTCRASASPTCRRARSYTFDKSRARSIASPRSSASIAMPSTSSTTARRPASGSRSSHPERITAIISQNGNAYEEGLSDGWNPIRAYWQDPSPANREALRAFLKPETTVWQYTHGVPDPTKVSPDGYRSTISIWPGRAPMTCSSTCSATTRAMSRSIRPSRNISAPTSRPSGGVGQERPVLPAAGRRGIQARHPARGRPLLRHRPFRAGNPCPEIAAAIRDFLT